MLNDPLTRAALSGGGEDSFEPQRTAQEEQPEGEERLENNETQLEEQMESQGQSQEMEVENPITDRQQTKRQPEQQSDEPQTKRQTVEVQTDNVRKKKKKRSDNRKREVTVGTQTEPFENLPSCSKDSSDDRLNVLRDELSELRNDFINKTGTEPSVRLHYSDQSSSNSTIKLGLQEEGPFRTHYSIPDSDESRDSDFSISDTTEEPLLPLRTVPDCSKVFSTDETSPVLTQLEQPFCSDTLNNDDTTDSDNSQLTTNTIQQQTMDVEEKEIENELNQQQRDFEQLTVSQQHVDDSTNEQVMSTSLEVNNSLDQNITNNSLQNDRFLTDNVIEEASSQNDINIREQPNSGDPQLFGNSDEVVLTQHRSLIMTSDLDTISVGSMGDVRQDQRVVDSTSYTNLETNFSDDDDTNIISSCDVDTSLGYDYIYQPRVKQKYVGHRNARYLKLLFKS